MTKKFAGALAPTTLRKRVSSAAVALVLLGIGVAQADSGFDAWKSAFAKRSASKGLTAADVQPVINATLSQRVIDLYNTQPEVVRPAWQYITKRVSDKRINRGQQKLVTFSETLSVLDKAYPVPAGILLAIWGIETNYGGYTGKMDTINSLATLAYASKRKDFFEGELVAVLKLLKEGAVLREELVGSWAGALGQPQFMPSNIKRYAADFDSDGRADIWGNTGDTLASIANYLTKHGWAPYMSWGCPAALTSKFDWNKWNPQEKLSRLDWQQRGVIPTSGYRCQLAKHHTAQLVAPAGASGAAFLVTDNFRVIRRYNNSVKYALAVALLGDAIVGKSYDLEWPTHEQKFEISDVAKVQARLNELGFNAGPADGKPGYQTRKALRAFQRKNSLVPDGYLSNVLVAKVLGRTTP